MNVEILLMSTRWPGAGPRSSPPMRAPQWPRAALRDGGQRRQESVDDAGGPRQRNVPWANVHVFQIDERIAPAGDPDRNYVHLRASLLEHAPIPPDQIYAMPVKSPDSDAAAQQYAHTLEGIAGKPPVLDLAHLGLGPDGTQPRSFPRSGPQRNGQGRCHHRRLSGPPSHDADYPVINRARRILWLVSGPDKVSAFPKLRAADPSCPPGRSARRRPCLLADREAAGQ